MGETMPTFFSSSSCQSAQVNIIMPESNRFWSFAMFQTECFYTVKLCTVKLWWVMIGCHQTPSSLLSTSLPISISFTLVKLEFDRMLEVGDDPMSLNSVSLPRTLPPISSIFSHQLRLVGQYNGDCGFVVVFIIVSLTVLVLMLLLLLLKLEYGDPLSRAFICSDSCDNLSPSRAIVTTASVFSLSSGTN